MTNNLFVKWSVTALLTLTPVLAQPIAKAIIPFDFHVGETKMSAGAYTVRTLVPGTVQLRRDDLKASALVMTFGVTANKSPRNPQLIFNRYGNSYFLSQVWSEGNQIGKQLQKSKPERESANAANTAIRQASVPSQAHVALTSSR